MFKKIFLICLTLLSPLTVSAENFTVRGYVGYNQVSLKTLPGLKIKVTTGQVFGASIGYKFTSCIRGEVEGCYRYNGVESQIIRGGKDEFIVPLRGKMESMSILANVIFTWPFFHYFQPYVGIGTGSTSEHADWVIALIENNIWYDFQEGKRSGVSYQAIAGVHIPPQNGIYCAAEFRILDSVLDHMTCFNRSFIFSIRKEF